MNAVVCLMALFQTAPPTLSAWSEDERGRRFRTGFDQGSRWYAGALVSVDLASEAEYGFEAGFRHRQRLDWPDEEVSWKIDQRALSLRLVPAEALRVEATLYEGRYHRWTRESRIVVPTTPPKYIPFPMNVGIEGTLGKLELSPRADGALGELAVQHAQVVFDFWRKEAMTSHALLGVGPSWDMRLFRSGVDQIVAPMSRLTVALHHEWAAGRQVLDVDAEGSWALTVGQGWGPRGRASARYEWVVLAINDLPVSVLAEVAWRYDVEHDLTATAGVRWSATLSR